MLDSLLLNLYILCEDARVSYDDQDNVTQTGKMINLFLIRVNFQSYSGGVEGLSLQLPGSMNVAL